MSDPRKRTDRAASDHQPPPPSGRYLVGLSLGALGIVYGDIGTSPLYALRESFSAAHGVDPTAANVMGVLSLIFWSLIVLISVKYLEFVLRADNRGEGGILALTSLVTLAGDLLHGRRVLVLLGLFATALLYGEGMITPAITVLSAVEGLGVATSLFEPYIIPITIGILVSLFYFQRMGTAGVAKIFGPVTLVWFITIAVLGVAQIAKEPSVLWSFSPGWAFHFFVENRSRGFLVLGSVVLVVTGAEALYADLGHFGRRPIRLAWFAVVLPALLLNYLGQGALILRDPSTVTNPFFLMAPPWALYPVVMIATAAAVIASQALISGAYSLTMQAVQLGYSPRVMIEHTSAEERGQIYVPAINWVLMIACIGLVLGFRSSSRLAAAYGVAVTTTMVVTSILFYSSRARAVEVGPALGASSWWPLLGGRCFVLGRESSEDHARRVVPLLVGVVIFALLTTWKKGRQILTERVFHRVLPRGMFLDSIMTHPPHRVPGTAVFMYNDPRGTPPALMHN